MDFREVPQALGLTGDEWGFLTGFFQFVEEPADRLSQLCVMPQEKVPSLLRALETKGLIKARTRNHTRYYSLAPLEEWLPDQTKAQDPDLFHLEVETLQKLLTIRGREAITVVATREMRRKDLLVPEVVRYSTTIFPTVDLRVGTKCNLNCVYCLLGHENRYLRPVKDIIEDLRFARELNLEKVSFTGGEPTLHPALPKLVAAAKALGFRRITLVTNGVTVSVMSRLEDLAKAGVNAIGISFDTPHRSTAERIWQIHHEPESAPSIFDRVKMAFDNVAKFPSFPLQSIAVVTAVNFRELPDLALFFVDLKKRLPNLFVPTLDFVMPEENAWINRATVVPRLSDTIPYVRRALEIAHQNGLFLTFRGFPFCLLPGLEAYSFDRYMTIFNVVRGPEGPIHDRFMLDLRKTKAESCRTCKWYRECPGVSRSYANLHGLDELTPVFEEVGAP